MSIKDRGTKKWTSIMLPEHVEMLKEVFSEDDRVEKPILDEQKLWEIKATLRHALDDDVAVTIKYYKDHAYKTVSGNIVYVDPLNKILHLDDVEIPLDDVIDVQT